MKRPATRGAAPGDAKKPRTDATPPEFWDYETNPSMWLGGCGKHATDRTKHKAKEVTKGVAAGEQMFKACPGNTQCIVLSKGVFAKPGEKVTIEVTLTTHMKNCDFYVGLLGQNGLGTYDGEVYVALGGVGLTGVCQKFQDAECGRKLSDSFPAIQIGQTVRMSLSIDENEDVLQYWINDEEVMAPDLVEAASELRSKATRSGPWCGWRLFIGLTSATCTVKTPSGVRNRDGDRVVFQELRQRQRLTQQRMEEKCKEQKAKTQDEAELRIFELREGEASLTAQLQQLHTAAQPEQDLAASLAAGLAAKASALEEDRQIVEDLRRAKEDTERQSSSKRHVLQLLELARAEERHQQQARQQVLEENVPRARQLHNSYLNLKGNIRVFCRFRPLLPRESEEAKVVFHEDEQSITLQSEMLRSVTGLSEHCNSYEFQFDQIFGPQATQLDVFEELSLLVQSALDGYKVAIFAYGQTGGGKTYTMDGPRDTTTVAAVPDTDAGVIPRAVDLVFREVEELRSKGWDFEVKCTLLEVYNESVFDILGPRNSEKERSGAHGTDSRQAIDHFTERPVRDAAAVHKLLAKAARERHTAATALNDRSSRSHAVFQLSLEGHSQASLPSRSGLLSLVDLAGSERVMQSQVTGEHLKEAQYINRSLSALGDVIEALKRKKPGGACTVGGPCEASELASQVAVSMGRMVAAMIKDFWELLDPFATAINDAGPERGADLPVPSGEDEKGSGHHLTASHDRLADGLWLFLDIYDRMAAAIGVGTHGLGDSNPLRRFLQDVPDGRVLATVEDWMPDIKTSTDHAVAWCEMLLGALQRIHGNVSSALQLSSGVLIGYRSLPQLEQSFDVPSHLAYLDMQPNWTTSLLRLIHQDHSGLPMLSRSSSFCEERIPWTDGSPGRRGARAFWFDATGLPAMVRPLTSLLDEIQQTHQLSYTVWSLQSAHFPVPSCRPDFEVLYDPTACLEGWAKYIYIESVDGSLLGRYEPRAWREREIESSLHRIPTQREGLISPPVPVDVTYVSPLVGNCHQLKEMLTAESMTISKLVYVAFNPTLLPPEEASPNFTALLETWRETSFDVSDRSLRSFLLAQCSLRTISQWLLPLHYRLLHVEHFLAVYVHTAFDALFPATNEMDAWRQGWFCSPLSKFIFGLESATGALLPSAELASRALCGPGTSLDCECLVPYQGLLCQETSVGKHLRPYQAAIHYIVDDTPEHLQELIFSLKSLFKAFNAKHDYPVLIFHDGLSSQSRQRLRAASLQRIWFFSVGEQWLPKAQMHSSFGLGYMAQSRFRSQPLFDHPAVQGFDYLWSLDSDSHFPSQVKVDPFLELHQNSHIVMSWSYMTSTSPASVRKLWDYTMIYAMKEHIDLWSEKLNGSVGSRAETSHFISKFLVSNGLKRMPAWNYNVLMTDCEVLRLSFFRKARYRHYFDFLDSMEGFFRHRWGDHAVRSLGLALALWEEDRSTWRIGAEPRVKQMELPYAHQDFCQCHDRKTGPCRPIHDPKQQILHSELQGLRKRFWTCEA
ncbi:Carboxy-terminal kinesin 2 (XCTK2) [Durusdinium trenchii]|uniref:Carboxy-terminal kinesin 2 (XCTK2) n=1 Tax=Durusdinium trenchii TaxID=1381693 RepID=A0ABP0M082_9DINO